MSDLWYILRLGDPIIHHEAGILDGSVFEFKQGIKRLFRKILRPGDWLVDIDDENEDDIIIEKPFPDGYTYMDER